MAGSGYCVMKGRPNDSMLPHAKNIPSEIAASRPILIVEDNDADFDVLRSTLRAAGVERPLERLGTGQEIAEYLAEAGNLPPSRYPLVILLDLNLPGAEGQQVLGELRNHPLLQVVPVIMLTTSSQPNDIDACYKLGASGYMVKPLDLERFESMVRSLSHYWLNCVELPGFKDVR
jgi:CheY-like chemotaxis protein